MPLFLNALILTSLVSTLIISDTPVSVIDTQNLKSSLSSNNTTGYKVLKLLLEDEQYLTSIRRTKMIITFGDISEISSELIDDISDSSEQAVDELEKLAEKKPYISFEDISDSTIGKATLDSLRMATAKEFFFDSDNFEKNLLLSQLKVLRLISHLAAQLKEIEPNTKRKIWLGKLSEKYEKYYQRVNTRITINV